MELSQFIKNCSHTIEASEKSVFIFQGSSYSHNFFTQFFDDFKKSVALDCKSIDIQSGDFSYKSQLETMFLGMHCIYWLGDISNLKAKQKDECVKYLTAYQGPHKIILFCDQKVELSENKHLMLIAVKDKYFFDDAKKFLITQDFQQTQRIVTFLHEIYKFKNSFTLDELFLLKKYQNLIPVDSKEFYTLWVTRLIIPDTSLYTLSQFLFEKKEEDFFRLWLQIQSLYSEVFWIAFWSDQLYRSYFFIAFTQEKNFMGAKQVSFGLPFSFIKQTFKQYELVELQNFHKAIFATDAILKNGGTMHQIDQLYFDFFANKFKN